MQPACRKRLKNDKRGVLDLPVKLLVVMIILALFLPIVSNAVESNEKSMMLSEMEQETGNIIDSVRATHFSGTGSGRHLDVSLPAGCEIVIGGSGTDAYSIRECYNGTEINTRYIESPAIKFGNSVTLTGNCSLTITSIGNGEPTVKVTVQ